MKKDKYNIDSDADYLEAASATDCTGLIPRQVQSEDELDSYKNICKFSPTQINAAIQPEKKDKSE